MFEIKNPIFINGSWFKIIFDCLSPISQDQFLRFTLLVRIFGTSRSSSEYGILQLEFPCKLIPGLLRYCQMSNLALYNLCCYFILLMWTFWTKYIIMTIMETTCPHQWPFVYNDIHLIIEYLCLVLCSNLSRT